MIDLTESKKVDLIVLCTAMLVIALVSVILRIWSIRVSPNHRFGYDDLFAILALESLGRHAATVPPEDLLKGPKIIFIATFFYDAAITFPKFSVLFFYRRIFERTSTWLLWSLWIIGGMNAAWLISAWISTIFQCFPVNAAWDPTAQPGARCFDQWTWFLGTAIPSMIIDLLILILPLPLLWKLKASWRRKALVSGIFVCGYCVIVVSIGRLVSLAQAGSGLLDDLTWSTIPYIMWVQCEGPISVMSVSLPNIIQLVKHLRRGNHAKDSTNSSSGLSSHQKSVDSRRFIRLEPYTSDDLGNSTLVSSQQRMARHSGEDVNIIHEVDITAQPRED